MVNSRLFYLGTVLTKLLVFKQHLTFENFAFVKLKKYIFRWTCLSFSVSIGTKPKYRICTCIKKISNNTQPFYTEHEELIIFIIDSICQIILSVNRFVYETSENWETCTLPNSLYPKEMLSELFFCQTNILHPKRYSSYYVKTSKSSKFSNFRRLNHQMFGIFAWKLTIKIVASSRVAPPISWPRR